MGSNFKSLVAYQLAVALADELHTVVRDWPPLDKDTVGVQVVRSADSVGANIAEGYGRWTQADQRRFLYVARGSLQETEYWLDRARARGLTVADYSHRIAEIARTLNGLITSKAPR